MQHFKRPEIMVLKGEEAITVLNEYIFELEEQRQEELTQEQAKAMIKLAKGLISIIQAETQTQHKAKETLLPRIKSAIANFFSPALQASERPTF